MKFTTTFTLGYLSKEKYRHYPLLYFAHGANGFLITIIGITFTIKF